MSIKKTLILHDAKKELPKKTCEVLVFMQNEYGEVYHIALVMYSAKYKLFNVGDYGTKEEAKFTAMKCAFWAYPPKKITANEERENGRE